MEQRDRLFWIWLSERLGAASRDFRRLITLYENPYDIFHLEDVELERIEGISERTVQALSDKSLHEANEIIMACQRYGIGILPYGNDAYPHALREIERPPVVLYYRGTLPDLNQSLCIAMVGTRRMSQYGMHTAYRLSYELAAVGATVVSGMAAGIDGVCAGAALAAKGKTIAVLGCGVDLTYPEHHRGLKEMLERDGLILSEYPPGTPPNHYHFPARNRIISGLAQGTVVVEAGLRSGSLITAKDAILQGRDVFAVPANVGSVGAEGTNGLLRDGANMAICSEDILARYQYVYAEVLEPMRLSDAKQKSTPDLRWLERLGIIALPPQIDVAHEAPPEKPSLPKTKRTPRRSLAKKAEASAAKPAIEEAEPKASPTPAKEKTPDAVIESLTPIQLNVLKAMPDDRAVTLDSLSNLGYTYGELIASVTMLEILGLVEKLPGALYMKT